MNGGGPTPKNQIIRINKNCSLIALNINFLNLPKTDSQIGFKNRNSPATASKKPTILSKRDISLG